MLHFQREKVSLSLYPLHTHTKSTLFLQPLSLSNTELFITLFRSHHIPLPYSHLLHSHSISFLHSHSYSASLRAILYYLRSLCSNNFLLSYIHPPTHSYYYTTSFHIFKHPSTSSNIIIHSASQQNQSKHLLLQSTQLRYFDIKSASIFNFSIIIYSLSENFHTSITNHVFFIWKS